MNNFTIPDNISEDTLSKLYQNWRSNLSQSEYHLLETILDYENRYFEDMTCEEGSLCWDISSFAVEETEYLDLNLETNLYRFYIVNDSSEYSGRHNWPERKIEITQSYINAPEVILHEMIHAYEYILQNKQPVLYDMLFLRLYHKLQSLIPDLDERISDHAEIYGQSKLSHAGGYHGILFYLKSLDLDIRCGFQLGTVCGYGRDTGDMFY